MGRSIPCDCGGWAIYRRRNDGMAYLECNKCGGVFELNVPWDEKVHGYVNINKPASQIKNSDNKSYGCLWVLIGIFLIFLIFLALSKH